MINKYLKIRFVHLLGVVLSNNLFEKLQLMCLLKIIYMGSAFLTLFETPRKVISDFPCGAAPLTFNMPVVDECFDTT
jgi:hypothetical protein